MAEVVDIAVDTDISIVNGDLLIGFSDDQHIEHILTARKGQFYQFPTLGYGAQDLILGSIHKASEKRKIRTELEADNYRVNKITILDSVDNLVTEIDATRK